MSCFQRNVLELLFFITFPRGQSNSYRSDNVKQTNLVLLGQRFLGKQMSLKRLTNIVLIQSHR